MLFIYNLRKYVVNEVQIILTNSVTPNLPEKQQKDLYKKMQMKIRENIIIKKL